MAAGALDGNGIWQYGEDDARDTFSDLLNIGQDSTSDAIGSDRARLATLETAGTLSAVIAAGLVTAASGWAIGVTVGGRKKNGVAWLNIDFTRTGANLVVAADGTIPPSTVATFNSGWVPAAGMIYPTWAQARTAVGYVGSNSWVLTQVGPGTTLNTGATIRLLATYPL